MEKKESKKVQDIKSPRFRSKKLKTSRNSNNELNKSLPWWVELFFVQIGLPDKLLIKILNAKKKSNELIKNEKKSLIIFLFAITTFAYFYPVINLAKNKLECEINARNYITKNKNIISINKSELKMLSTNFCYGGREIYEIENLKN